MAFIPEDKITDIKNAVDIVEIISDTVLLKKAGKNHIGLCPFHSEKTPSFTVSPEKQIFHCFGCGEGGNIFSFIMKRDNLSFPEAAKMLARRYGIELPSHKMSPEQKRRMSERENLLAVNRKAMDFFRHNLHDEIAGKKAMAYLLKRGMTHEIINDCQIGYAPAGWDNLTDFFSKKKIPLDLVKQSGLILPRKEKGGFYDRFRDRIMFPIFDLSMRVIGFGGRVMDDALPKYLNSPETPMYNKSRSLYGLHSAKAKCREKGFVYIVEGYFDFLSLFQHGMENTVATLGTALTADHIRLLKGFVGEVILVYDSDEGGMKAVLRNVGLFIREYVNAKIMVLPDGYDPDSYIFEFGPESFMEMASQAQGLIHFLIESAIEKHGISIEGKMRIVSDLQGPLASMDDSVTRSLFVKELAERIGIDEAAILEKIRGRVDGKADLPSSFQERGGRVERQIIAMMLQCPDTLPEIRKYDVLEYFEDSILKSIGETILHMNCSGDHASDIMEIVDDSEQKSIIASLLVDEVTWDDRVPSKEITRFVRTERKRREDMLMKKIKAAEEKNDYELLIRLLSEKHKMVVMNEKRKMDLLRRE